jgi:hypothetical protein
MEDVFLRFLAHIHAHIRHPETRGQNLYPLFGEYEHIPFALATSEKERELNLRNAVLSVSHVPFQDLAIHVVAVGVIHGVQVLIDRDQASNHGYSLPLTAIVSPTHWPRSSANPSFARETTSSTRTASR